MRYRKQTSFAGLKGVRRLSSLSGTENTLENKHKAFNEEVYKAKVNLTERRIKQFFEKALKMFVFHIIINPSRMWLTDDASVFGTMPKFYKQNVNLVKIDANLIDETIDLQLDE